MTVDPLDDGERFRRAVRPVLAARPDAEDWPRLRADLADGRVPHPRRAPHRPRQALAVAAALAVLAGVVGLGVVVRTRGAGRIDVQTTGDHPGVDGSTTPTSTSTSTTTPRPPPGPSTGWYLPEGLPTGWTIDRAVAQGTDRSGEAQLWLTSPTGNVLLVSSKVPTDPPWTFDDEAPHPLAGQQPVVEFGDGWSTGFTGEDEHGGLLGRWPWATVLVQLADAAQPSSVPAELDVLAAALRPVDTDRWRAALGTVERVDEDLRTAATLVDLPDEI